MMLDRRRTKRTAAILSVIVLISVCFPWSIRAAQDRGSETRPTAKSIPLLIDVGAKRCIPCKMMAPILEDLKKEYAGVFGVEFIDVWENPGVGEKYGIRGIPTQIFYDASGKEFYRHMGFFSKEQILDVFRRHGVVLKKPVEVKK